ncbi:AraC family transcriptional regulator [Pseudoalteromonas sp. MMG013]|uniref:AraC family transcriptional regulator n=1 Tax=Pseudoalteromonas sp. MMG013 TaxID=2822687 RepID=UPI001B35C77F|nr:AraC family transcriptional regulator [Pseudoalteromonas sp. MMG013]MBQ4863012.1 AraC family transcriptional regulator [Pseudoalteromonas sp. MMG013]
MKHYFDTDTECLTSHTLALPIVEIAIQRGVNSNRLLKGTKLFHEDLQNPQKKISFTQLNTLVSNAVRLLPDDGLSFLLGQHWLFNQTSHSGQALLNSKHLTQMSRVLQIKQFELCPFVFFVPYRSQTHTHYILNFAIATPPPLVAAFYFEMITAQISALCKWRFGFVNKITIKLPFSKPKHIEQYYAHLAIQYQFDYPCFSLCIPNELLHVKQVSTPPIMCHYHLQQAHNTPHTVGFIQYVCDLLLQEPKSVCDDIAQQLDISPATLKRKFKQHNTSMQTLKDTLQKQLAVISIGEKGYSNEQAAEQLNFTDLTNFRRTFKRWTGMTPSQLREIMMLKT